MELHLLAMVCVMMVIRIQVMDAVRVVPFRVDTIALTVSSATSQESPPVHSKQTSLSPISTPKESSIPTISSWPSPSPHLPQDSTLKVSKPISSQPFQYLLPQLHMIHLLKLSI